jgi:hypothetical protein
VILNVLNAFRVVLSGSGYIPSLAVYSRHSERIPSGSQCILSGVERILGVSFALRRISERILSVFVRSKMC